NGEGDPKSADWILLKMDALHAVSVLEERSFMFDIVYLDPPFADGLYEGCLMVLAKSDLLNASSLVVVEHHYKNVLQELYGKLAQTDQRRVGDNCLSFYSVKSS
ncbi:MAG: RsmD family RNA methyltransferase, partial [Nitrospinaceae bacterium]|nr:RsmD family RNA methyltransferase [Nitrospinaceae bacterium]